MMMVVDFKTYPAQFPIDPARYTEGIYLCSVSASPSVLMREDKKSNLPQEHSFINILLSFSRLTKNLRSGRLLRHALCTTAPLASEHTHSGVILSHTHVLKRWSPVPNRPRCYCSLCFFTCAKCGSISFLCRN